MRLYICGLSTKERKWLSFSWGSKYKDSNKEIPKVLLCVSIVQNVVMLDTVYSTWWRLGV
jgi:hypothetical protein